MQKSILISLFFMGYQSAHAQLQPSLPPSPTAAALGKYVDNPVSYYTGTPQIALPIYTIGLKDFELPISLSYNPQDVKVETVASYMGLGWSLNAGGVITRSVKDIPDDERADVYDRSEQFDFTRDMHAWGFEYAAWGYLYAISEGQPFITENGNNGAEQGYYGTDTYNLDLFDIYQNRKAVSPERAIIEHFFYPIWGTLAMDSWDNYTMKPVGSRNFNALFQFADLEPDIFYFNFAGYSGKFVFEVENGAPKIKTIPYQDLDFDYKTDLTTGRLVAFEVTDENGTKYTFEDIEKSVEYLDKGNFGGRRRVFHSAWWLTTITTTKNERLEFRYEDEQINTVSAHFYTDQYGVRAAIEEKDPKELDTFWDEFLHLNESKRIKSITGDHVFVEFSATESRTDLFPTSDGKIIASVSISALDVLGASHRVKKFNFDHDYFLSTENKTRRNHNGNQRLRLRSVQEFGVTDTFAKPPYTFEYHYYDDQGDSSIVFPNRYSYNKDLWGYANGSDNPTPIPALNIYPDNYPKGDLRMYSVYPKDHFTGAHKYVPGGDRLPNENYMDIGVLTKITYPTGGSTSYDFEPHAFVMEGQEYIGGGLRIKSITKNSNQGSTVRYRYQYTQSKDDETSSGKIVSLPMFATLPQTDDLTDWEEATASEWVKEVRDLGILLETSSGFYAVPITELGRTSGSNVGYTHVIEYRSDARGSFDQGWTAFRYSFPAEFGDTDDYYDPITNPPEPCNPEENGSCDDLFAATKVHNFFMYGDDREEASLDYFPATALSHLTPANPNYDWNRGKLLSKKVYDATGKLVLEETMDYENYFPNGKTAPQSVYGIKLAQFHPHITWGNGGDADAYAFRVAKYELLTEVTKVLSSKTIKTYGKQGPAYSTTTAYTYGGSGHKNPTLITEASSGSDLVVTTRTYPTDYAISGPGGLEEEEEGIGALLKNGISSIPVEVARYKRKGSIDYLTEAQITLFNIRQGHPVPTKTERIETKERLLDFDPSYVSDWGYFRYDNRYTEEIAFRKYDHKGHVLEVEEKNTGVTTCYVWGYGHQYLIAKVVNATYSEIETVLGAELIALNQGYQTVTDPGSPVVHEKVVLTDRQIRNTLSLLRRSLPHAAVTTYTYKPLVGVTSETDPGGETTYFEYDPFNRLARIRDANQAVRKTIKYNYKTQQ